MNIATELSAKNLKVFIEEANWIKVIQPFMTEVVKIGLVAYIIDGQPIFHDTLSGSSQDTHPALMFCQDELTFANFNKKLMKAGVR